MTSDREQVRRDAEKHARHGSRWAKRWLEANETIARLVDQRNSAHEALEQAEQREAALAEALRRIEAENECTAELTSSKHREPCARHVARAALAAHEQAKR